MNEYRSIPGHICTCANPKSRFVSQAKVIASSHACARPLNKPTDTLTPKLVALSKLKPENWCSCISCTQGSAHRLTENVAARTFRCPSQYLRPRC
eukprot:6181817-Pleurochrysis_carterae.AAC.1